MKTISRAVKVGTKMHIATSIKEIKTLVSKRGVKLTPKDIKALQAIIASYALDAIHDSDVGKEVWKLARARQ